MIISKLEEQQSWMQVREEKFEVHNYKGQGMEC